MIGSDMRVLSAQTRQLASGSIGEGMQHGEYALRRQIERLPMTGSIDVLMSLSIANKPLVIPEISQVAGLTDDDTEKGILDLLNLRLAYKDPDSEPAEPAYSMNNNTSRLVQQTYKGDARLSGCQAAFKYLTGERVPAAKRKAIGRTIIENMEKERLHGFEAALQHLKDNMTGELADSPDLYGQLGRLYGNQVKLYAERDQHDDKLAQQYCISAREAYSRATRLGTRKPAVYEQWIEMEIQIAESMIRRIRLNKDETIAQCDVTSQWVRCVEVAETGIDRCGESKQLCYKAGYCASREGQSKNFDNRFTEAQSAYGRAKQWFYRALNAPIAGDNKDLFNPITIYRGLVLALAELDQSQSEIQQVLSDFRQSVSRQTAYENVVDELRRKYPALAL